jgi:hypothetical protein
MSDYEYAGHREEGKHEPDSFDHMPSVSSSQRKDPTRHRRQGHTPMSPIRSDCFLDNIVDVDVEVSVRPTPTTATPIVVCGRQRIGSPHTGVGHSDTACEEGGAGFSTREKSGGEDPK